MDTSKKILELNHLIKKIKSWKEQRETIVFTNGCFDILHPGHIESLEKARSFGDRLVVGVNSDLSVKGLKGPGRPVNEEKSRLRMIAALNCVDATIIFDAPTPYELIQNILPDVLVKGKDYDISNIVGADIVMANGGRVETVELVEGHSTSQIIERINKLNKDQK